MGPFVVGVGASAGGLEALRTLFGGMPPDSGATFVVAVHRSAGHERRLVELLQPYTQLPVMEVDERAPLEPNRILVIPANAAVRAIDTHVRLATLGKLGAESPRIDELFRALAAAHGSRSIGVVLTGAGSDGALGLRQIKAAAGLVIAQAPDEAEDASMPRSALGTGAVDLVLPLREMAQAIVRYCKAVPQMPALVAFEVAEASDGRDVRLLEVLLDLIEARTGRDLSVYRPALLVRGVGKRMRVRGIAHAHEYVRLLERDADEIAALARDLLADGSEFFREPGTSALLENDVLPRLLSAKGRAPDTLRAWFVGCGTGEEAYSLAIQLLEECTRRDIKPSIKLFATDVAEEQLQRARRGVYLPQIESSVSLKRLASYFVPDEGGHRLRPEVRALVVFARHDVCRDYPFPHLDLIVCRPGLFADLGRAERRHVLRSFYHALEPNGLLVVGPQEAVAEPQLFALEGEDGQTYRRIEGAARSLVFAAARESAPDARAPDARAPDAHALHLRLLERYIPPSVLVDDHNRVIRYSTRASRYARLPGGVLTHDALELFAEPLRSAVQGGLEIVARTAKRWTSDALLVDTGDGARRVVVHVDPVDEESAAVEAKLIVFEELDHPIGEARVRSSMAFTSTLEHRLDEASRRLRAVVAEQPGGHRNQAALAEILESMETAKAELKAVNDQLSALNHENAARLEDLTQVSSDLEVLLESTGLATLFLDGDLKIIRFTPPLAEIFAVSAADQGRPLAEIPHRLRDRDLVADAGRVLKHLAPVDREIESESGKWFLVRMLPYRAPPLDTGVAITLIDVTSRKKAEQRLRETDRRKDEFIALLAHELRNPLAPISSGIEILRRRDLEPSVVERVTATMSRQAAQLVRLIDDLLDVSRITSGRLQLRKAPVVLGEIVRDAVAAVRPLFDRARHDLKLRVPAEPIVLDADAARLTQVLANLLNNAARYTPPGGRIELAVRLDGDSVVVTVEDNGYGIPASALPHLFEMFYQAGDPRSPAQGGLGIGLALAKSLVEMHGGSIDAASPGVDRGSVFTLRLPIAAHAHASESISHDAAAMDLGGHRVLVVDDNADAANTLAMLIRALGQNEVHVALSGAEALPLAERVKPDTVFLDLKMPDMDGYEVAQRLRSEPWGGDAWLVALTGWGLEEHKRRTKDVGFDQHLIKPADRGVLEDILRRPSAGARVTH